MDLESIRNDPKTLVETDSFRIYATIPQNDTFVVHANVYEWSKGVYKEMTEAWGAIVEEFYKIGVDKVYTIVTEEHPNRFSEMFGFIPTKIITLADEKGEKRVLELFEFPIKEVVEGV